jgi:hypothetical protein
MAILSSPQVLALLQENRRPAELETCRIHDRRARFHTEPHLRSGEVDYYAQHIDWVSLIIDREKADVYKALLSLPVETIDFTEGIFDELKKVFGSQNRFTGFEFVRPEMEDDFVEYLKEIKYFDFWKTKGFKAMKSAINSFVIIDLPAMLDDDEGAVLTSKFPEPYFYLLDCQAVECVDIDDQNNVEYIIFHDKCDHNILYAFDDKMYRVIQKSESIKPEDKNAGIEYTIISEVPHDLGYTPARSFWSTPYNDRSKIQKSGPISNSLSKLDWLLFLYTSTKHSELYAGFPVEVVYEQKCDYKDAIGNACEGGRIRTMVNVSSVIGQVDMKEQYQECPTCKNKRSLGAGRVLTAPAMASKDDVDLIQGMNRVPADTVSLKYLLERIDGLETGIAINIAGYTEDDISQAQNKDQVRSRYQSQYTVLLEVKENFENIDRFVMTTLGKLRYGKAFKSCTINYGDQFFIYSVDTLQDEYKKSKDGGFPVYELASQINQIIATKYKENPAMMERVRIMSAIEPYQAYTMDELINLDGSIGLNTDMLRLKVDFETYVKRFEREYTNLSQFMQFSDFETKVDFVREKLIEYVQEDYAEQDQAETDAAAADAKMKADALAKSQQNQGGTGGGLPDPGTPKPGDANYKDPAPAA